MRTFVLEAKEHHKEHAMSKKPSIARIWRGRTRRVLADDYETPKLSIGLWLEIAESNRFSGVKNKALKAGPLRHNC
jgi:hypothetical protein